MKKLTHGIALMVVSFWLTGCVTGTRQVDLAAPSYDAGKSANADVYLVAVKDNRTFEANPDRPSIPSVKGDLAETPAEKRATLIGRQRNGYGKAMGDVALPGDLTVMDKTQELLRNGLESRGYNVTTNPGSPVQVKASIDEFWGWFNPGFWAVSFQARVSSTLEVMTKQGKYRFTVHGYGKNTGQVASDANWQLAFDRAMVDFLKNLDAKLDELRL